LARTRGRAAPAPRQSSAATLPPDFELADLLAVDPSVVIRGPNDEVGRFMLALGLAFNDLKGVDYLRFQLGTLRSASSAWPLAQRGQYDGMIDQLARLFAGVLHEIVEVFANGSKALASEEMLALLAELPSSMAAAWKAVAAVAQKDDRESNRSDATSIILVKLRNGLAFHYGLKALADGYSAHFDGGTALHSSHAVVSIGESMERTRFYFADAAAVAATARLTGLPKEQVHAQLFEVATQINEALRGVVTKFLLKRSGGMVPYPIRAP
jgi:hypothetical protein